MPTGEFLEPEFEERHNCNTPFLLKTRSPVWKCDCGQVWVYGDLRGFKGFMASAMWYPVDVWESNRGKVKNSTDIGKRLTSDRAAFWVGVLFIACFFVFVFASRNFGN